jgi:hypothetical protein
MSKRWVWALGLLLALLLLGSGASSPVEAVAEPSLASTAGFCDGVTQIPFSECEALRYFYFGTQGALWTDRTDWLVSTTPCSWYGVGCTDGHVSFLALTGNNLGGTLPTELRDLTQLSILGLGGNRISGTIPDVLGDVPLTQLFLFGNQLSGSLPASFSQLGNLEVLYLHTNQLSGPLPSFLGNLTKLEDILLYSNYFNGPLPASLGNLTRLRQFHIGSNALEGSFPLTITNLINLWNAGFEYNMLRAPDPIVADFLEHVDPGWTTTQTVPPTGPSITDVTATAMRLRWTPISYTGDGGYYELWRATTPGGPYTLHGHTTDKFAAQYPAINLIPNTLYYWVVRSYTPAHGLQQNALHSPPSAEISARTSALSTATPLPTPTGVTPTPTTTSWPFYLQRVEAEAGHITSPMSTVRDESASACYYVYSTQRDLGATTLTLTVPHDDTYYLWARVQGADYTTNSFWVLFDSGPEFWYEMSAIGPSWFWDPVHAQDQPPTSYYLAAGAHTLRFRAREPYARLDEVLLTSNAGYVPSATDVASCLSTTTPTIMPSPTATHSPSPAATVTPTPTPTRTATASPTWTSTPTRSRTPTLTPSASATAPSTLTPTLTVLRLFLPLVWR